LLVARCCARSGNLSLLLEITEANIQPEDRGMPEIS
jgi:hypothetical protein